MGKEKEIKLRYISYGELHLMLGRLAMDIEDHPNTYSFKNLVFKNGNDAISEFIRQENFRRHLFIVERQVLIEKTLKW